MKWGRIRFKDIWDVIIDTLAIYYRLNIVNYYDLQKKDEKQNEEG